MDWETVVVTRLIAGGVEATVDGALLVLGGNCCTAVVTLALTDATVEAAVDTGGEVGHAVVLLGDVLLQILLNEKSK